MARGALSRMRNVVKAEFDDLLSRMEDPKLMVGQAIRDMESALDDALVSVAGAIANERILDRRLKDQREEVTRWRKKAEEAVLIGEDELARKALDNVVRIERSANDLESGLKEACTASGQLKEQLITLKSKLESARTRRHSLVVRKSRLQNQEGASVLSPGIGEEAFNRFDKMCEDIEREEVTLKVYEEIVGSYSAEEEEIDKLATRERINEELKAMKEKLAQPNK